jgi:hypothetical protein
VEVGSDWDDEDDSGTPCTTASVVGEGGSGYGDVVGAHWEVASLGDGELGGARRRAAVAPWRRGGKIDGRGRRCGLLRRREASRGGGGRQRWRSELGRSPRTTLAQLRSSLPARKLLISRVQDSHRPAEPTGGKRRPTVTLTIGSHTSAIS